MANDYLGQAGLTALIAKIKTAISTAVSGLYTKPSTGVPKSDLASDVQASLGKADTALQSFTESDPVFSASVASGITSTDITNWNNKTSSTGTVTSVAVKMNNAVKGTVTTSGTIDLGTVITSHQDISGKQDKLPTSGTASETYAINVSGNAATASCVKGNYSGTITRDICIRGATDGNLVIAAPGTASEENKNHSIVFRLGGSINYTGNSTFNITTTGFDGNSSGTYNSRSYDNSGNDKQYVTSLASKRTTKVHCVYCNGSNYSTYGAPTSGWFLYETTGHADSDTYAIQTAQNYGGNRYFRSKSNGSWGAWKQVVNTGTSAVGSTSQPVYVNADGQVTACGDLVAASATKDNKGNNIYDTYEKKATSKYHVKGKINGNLYETINIDITTAIGTDSNTIYFVK